MCLCDVVHSVRIIAHTCISENKIKRVGHLSSKKGLYKSLCIHSMEMWPYKTGEQLFVVIYGYHSLSS